MLHLAKILASRFPWAVFLPWMLLSMTVLTLVSLAIKHSALRENYLAHRRADMRIQQGSYVPPFRAVAVSGDSVAIGEPPLGTRQVLFLLNSACPFCRATLPRWKEIATKLATPSFTSVRAEVVGLTTDSLSVAERYSKANQPGFPVVVLPTSNLKSLYRAYVVPQTVILDQEGRVVFARHGVISTSEAIDSIVTAALAPDRFAGRLAESKNP